MARPVSLGRASLNIINHDRPSLKSGFGRGMIGSVGTLALDPLGRFGGETLCDRGDHRSAIREPVDLRWESLARLCPRRSDRPRRRRDDHAGPGSIPTAAIAGPRPKSSGSSGSWPSRRATTCPDSSCSGTEKIPHPLSSQGRFAEVIRKGGI
jgi:hypothetical protein